MDVEWYNVILKLFVIAISVERSLKFLYDLSFVKRIVDKEGIFFHGTDLKAGISLFISIAICVGLDYRVIALLTNGHVTVPPFVKMIDYYITGSLIASGSEMVNSYFKRLKAGAAELKNDTVTVTAVANPATSVTTTTVN